MKEGINWNTGNRKQFSLVFALTAIKLSLEMPSELSFLSPLFLTARDLEIHIKILVESPVSMSALDDFSSLPTGILVNPTESYNAIQSYMRKQNASPVQRKKNKTPNPHHQYRHFPDTEYNKVLHVLWSSSRFWEWWGLGFLVLFFFVQAKS